MSELPPMLATIAEAAGLEAALRIARAHGGTRVTVPTLAKGKNWLTELVGEEAAAQVIEALGPAQRIDLPLPPDGSSWRAWHRERSQRIAALEAEDASASRIAREMGMTVRAVHLRRAKARERRRQGDLFSE